MPNSHFYFYGKYLTCNNYEKQTDKQINIIRAMGTDLHESLKERTRSGLGQS